MRFSFRIWSLPSKPSAVKEPPINTRDEAKHTDPNGADSSQEKETLKLPVENKPALLKPAEESRASMPPPPAPEQANKPAAKSPPVPAAAPPSSVPQPEEPKETTATVLPAAQPSIATVVPAAEHHALETPEMKTTAEEQSTAPGSPKAIALVQSTSPQRQKASEPPAEAQSPPPLPKITISTLDKNSHKILIHTKEVPEIQAPSPHQNGQDGSSPPYGKKSKRKEQHDIDRHHQSKRKSPEKVEKRSQWCRSPPEDGIPSKKLKLDGCDDAVEVARKSINPTLQRPEGGVSLPEQARHNVPKAVPICVKSTPPPAHPRTPPCTSMPPSLSRNEEDTRPLDLSVSHRGAIGAISQDPPRRPRGRPSLPLPSVMPLPLVTKRPSPPQTTTTTTTYSPPTSVPPFHKLPPAQTSSSSHHHHHHHHRGNSKSFRKNANLACFPSDLNAGATKIVIKHLPPHNSNNNNIHRA